MLAAAVGRGSQVSFLTLRDSNSAEIAEQMSAHERKKAGLWEKHQMFAKVSDVKYELLEVLEAGRQREKVIQDIEQAEEVLCSIVGEWAYVVEKIEYLDMLGKYSW